MEQEYGAEREFRGRAFGATGRCAGVFFWNKNTARSASLEDGAFHLQFRGRAPGATGRCAIDFFKGTRRYHLKTTMTIKKDSPGWAVFFRLEVRG